MKLLERIFFALLCLVVAVVGIVWITGNIGERVLTKYIAPTLSSLVRVVKWIFLAPVSLLGGALVCSFFITFGDLLFGSRTIPSGLVVFFGASLLPFGAAVLGMKFAPVKNSEAKWVIVIPRIALALFVVFVFVELLSGTLEYDMYFGGGDVLSELSRWWTTLLACIGFFVGLIGVFGESPENLAEF
ncbi:MAG: hypothetical protein AAF624_14310 [Bacteroidota bacterium]